MLKCISKIPVAYLHKDPIYQELISAANSVVRELEPIDFGFKSTVDAFDESRRKIYAVGERFGQEPLRNLLLTWYKKHLPVLLSYLCYDLKDETYKINDPDRLRFMLRFRILEDYDGYALAPHRDSSDTVFAFLLQLADKNPTTSVFLKDKHGALLDLEETNISSKESVRNRLAIFLNKYHGQTTEFSLTENQFKKTDKNAWVVWDSNGIAWQVFEDESYKNKLVLLKYDEINLTVPFGNLLALHNPLKNNFFNSSASENIKKHASHGFFPRKIDGKRPVLLFDLIAGYTDRDRLASDPNGKPDEYSIYFSKNETAEFLNYAGMV